MSANQYNNLLKRFSRMNVLIVGDVMVDAYLWGKVERISPEAPVPVVLVTRRENRLGGAANVALNIRELGANPVLCSVIGNDRKGKELTELLVSAGLSTEGIIRSRNRVTTTKFRVIGNHIQMLRVDEEMTHPLEPGEQKRLLERFHAIFRKQKTDLVIFQDYDKGVITPEIIAAIVRETNRAGIPTAVDPKKRNFLAYRNVTLFKPNLKELKEGLKIDFSIQDQEELARVSALLRERINCRMVLVTLSEEGVFIDYPEAGGKTAGCRIPSRVRSVSDVSGAGDTVISVAGLCLAAGANPVVMADISNLAGGLVCEEAGVVPVRKDKLLSELNRAIPGIKSP